MQEHHDTSIAGHQGVERTYESIHRHYYWPRMSVDVGKYVRTCDSCQRIKPDLQMKAGLLQPLPILERKWEWVSMDFITHLPRTKKGNDAIVVFVDMMLKMAHFAMLKTTATAPEVAK